jgi:O-antigen/teichoic acid export membrane protein
MSSGTTPCRSAARSASATPSATTGTVAVNASLLAISTVLTLSLQFVWQVVLARTLGDRGYGTYATIGALLVIGAALVEFGMGLVVIRDIAAHHAEAGRYLAATLVLQPFLAGLAWAALGALAWTLAYPIELRALLAVASISLLVDAFGNMCHNQLVAMERMRVPALAAPTHAAILIAAGIPVLLAGGGLWGVYVVALVAGALRSSGYWLALRWWGGRAEFPVDLRRVRHLLVEGWPLATLSAATLATRHGDKLIMTALLGLAATGELTTAFLVVFAAIEMLSTPVLVAALPLMSRLHRQGGGGALAAPLCALVTLAVASGLPVAVLGSLLAPSLALWLFGSGFGPAASVLRVMIWALVPALVANAVAQVLLVEGRQRDLLRIRALGLAVHVVLLLVMIPRMGILAAAGTAIATELLVLTLFLAHVRLEPVWWRALAARVFPLGGVALLTASVVLALRGVHPLLAGVAGALVAGVVPFAPGILAPADRLWLGELRANLPASLGGPPEGGA